MADKYTVSFNSDTSDSEEEESTENESESNDVVEVSLSLPRQPSPQAPEVETAEPVAEFTLNLGFDKTEADDDSCFTFDLGVTKKDDDEMNATASEERNEAANDLDESATASVETKHLSANGLADTEQAEPGPVQEGPFESDTMKQVGDVIVNGHNDDLIKFDDDVINVDIEIPKKGTLEETKDVGKDAKEDITHKEDRKTEEKNASCQEETRTLA